MENLIEIGLATDISALAQKESRGVHSCVDYKQVGTKALSVETFPPKERVY